MQMKKNNAPGLDDFPAEFYQTFWVVIKVHLMRMFQKFQQGKLPLFHLNHGTVILLPKKENVVQIQQYIPIYLLNVSFQVITKVGTNRVSSAAKVLSVAESVVHPTQTTFMPGRHILEGVVILHETIHDIYRKKIDGVLFEIDFKNMYDKAN
jgi:hypothetical protein